MLGKYSSLVKTFIATNLCITQTYELIDRVEVTEWVRCLLCVLGDSVLSGYGRMWVQIQPESTLFAECVLFT